MQVGTAVVAYGLLGRLYLNSDTYCRLRRRPRLSQSLITGLRATAVIWGGVVNTSEERRGVEPPALLPTLECLCTCHRQSPKGVLPLADVTACTRVHL